MQKKRLVVFTIDSSIGDYLLNRLFKSPYIEPAGVFYSTRIYGKSSSLFSVSHIIDISGYRYLWYLAKTTLLRRKRERKKMHEMGKKRGVHIVHTHDVNTPEAVDHIRSLNPDIILSCYFNQLIRHPIINLPLDLLNIHPGILPKYRGMEPVIRVVIQDRGDFGVTLHRVNEVFDAGEILRQGKAVLDMNRSLLQLNLDLVSLGVDLLEDFIHKGGAQSLGVQEDNYYSWPTKQEVRTFLETCRLL